ncbi:MAG: 2-C-methyl-D-erythritol 4-phosphate cytidylyltransferase [Hydrocarboniphaga sp.]|uniref:2-C-methyl-D-erythritol 4-phosphate cytidylyltransferase n=1 Tax=Hydrocarboniphaga sp. TaxID=2033016 RepID=UPI002616FEDB|nr:2-C-methyl-D-erythritol 4-phosphate cytidylyltransferase [Hydrocarboniphaga sp.]MDB5968989.1 2-C-methyl-D-erythritol 4-phosphate cytidylyltransferase [Hydrocarboniphaga sp.]
MSVAGRSKSASKSRYWAVIPAAGGGSRMGLAKPKQYLPLRERTLLEWSLAPFLDCGWIDGVVLVLAKSDSDYARLPVARHPKMVVTQGGAARAESVMAGLEAVATSTAGFSDISVLVHDAARPCLDWADLDRLRDEADDEHGGLLAIPMADTLKLAKQNRVAATVDRATYWRAQTPQLFRLDLLMRALRDAGARKLEITDEASAMEIAGYSPRLVRGRESNLKVTYPEDMVLADFWLQQQELQP